MPTRARFVALEGCSIIRPREAPGIVEITVSQGECREFPTMVSGTLGICEKSGPDHTVTANGRNLTFPRDAVSVRAPGTVWSSEAAPTGWVAINIAPTFLPDAGVSGSMAFLERGRHFDVGAVARRLVAAETPLQVEEELARLVNVVVQVGAIHEPEHGAAATNAAIARACDFLRSQAMHRPTLDDVARRAEVDKFALIRTFKRATGTTPHAYLVGVRLQEARRLLASGSPPSEVAFATGFADQAHLTRWFRRVYGLTPAMYSRQSRAVVGSSSIPFKTSG